MKLKVTRKFVLWLIGALLIGITSNALWDFFFKPVLLFAQNGILTLSTLGIQSFKDAIYTDIAKGHYDRASEELFALFTALLFSAIVAVGASPYVVMIFYKKQRQKMASYLNDIEAGTIIDESPTLESLKTDFANNERRHQRTIILAHTATVVLIVFLIMLFTVAEKIRYSGAAVSYYDQLIAITTPYLTDGKAKLTASEFAQVKNRNDYERIILELRSVAESNKQSVPTFKIW